MSSDKLLSRGQKMLQMSLSSKTALTGAIALNVSSKLCNVKQADTSSCLDETRVIKSNYSADTDSSLEEDFNDSFDESIDSDNSLKDPNFTPTKRDLRKAELSSDGEDDASTRINKTRDSVNVHLYPTVIILPNKDPAPANADVQRPAEAEGLVDLVVVDHEEVIVSKKKRAKRGRAKPDNWVRNTNKRLRMEGKEYKSTDSTNRKLRRVQPRLCKAGCEADQKKQCHNITEDERQELFNEFWSMTWGERSVLIQNLVERHSVKERTSVGLSASRRNFSYSYYFRKNGTRVPVCKNMFLTTLCIGEKTVYSWINKAIEAKNCPRPKRSRQNSLDKTSNLYTQAVEFLDSLPKLPSHYCRSSSDKMYLEPLFSTFMCLYRLYTDHCREKQHPIINKTSFKSIFDDMNLALFKPRKDQCDICCSYEAGNTDIDTYNKHIDRKNAARAEKVQDKEASKSDDSIAVITVDVQSVLLCPSLKASALYYKTKLAVHNYTIYDLASSDVTCYVWHEGEGDLSANTFSSFLVDYINHLSKSIKTLIIYSDGCGYQNRNCILANVLYKIANENNLTIYQKFLEKGHTQMEADSVHSTIERKLRNKSIYCPQQYVDYMKQARIIPRPYTIKYVSHDFFSDFKTLNYYSSIRPGSKVGDPVVNDIRLLKYSPEKENRIEYKLKYEDEFQELPRRSFVKSPGGEQVEKAYSAPLKIKPSKYAHLQELKSVLPKDYHAFYDSLLY